MAKRHKQLLFEGKWFAKRGDSFGGSLLNGNNPKCQRPLDSKLPILLTLRAKRSVMRLPKTFKIVNECVRQISAKHGVRIYKYANVGNHLHASIKIRSVRGWPAFVRELTGRIAQEVKETILDQSRGSNEGAKESFWLYRPHTRIVRGWRKAFAIVNDYVYLNQLEAQGFINRRDTKTLKDLRAIFADGS